MLVGMTIIHNHLLYILAQPYQTISSCFDVSLIFMFFFKKGGSLFAINCKIQGNSRFCVTEIRDPKKKKGRKRLITNGLSFYGYEETIHLFSFYKVFKDV